MLLARKINLEFYYIILCFRDEELRDKCKTECGVNFSNCHGQCDGDIICIIGCSRPLVDCENGEYTIKEKR